MATNVTIIHAGDFIRAAPDGRLDFEESKRMLLEVSAAAETIMEHRILLDTRHARSAMSITDLWYLADEISKTPQAFRRKTAVLCPAENFDQAGFFAMCAQNRGMLINAFTSFEDAIEWLVAA